MQDNDDFSIDPETKEFIDIICSYFVNALEGAKDEIEEASLLSGEEGVYAVIDKHCAKTREYLKLEGWID